MPIKVNNIPKYQADLKREMKNRVTRAGITVSRYAKELVSVAGPAPSRPGSPPHKQTGRLRMGINWSLKDDGTVHVNSSVKYGKYLDFGTRRMAARPWLTRAFNDMRGEIRSILTAPWRWKG